MSTKYLEDKNVFYLQTAPDSSYGCSVDEAPKIVVGDLLKEIKAKLLGTSCFGIRNLARILKSMDVRGNCKLDVDEFRWGLMDYGIQVTKEEAAELLKKFDPDSCGTVHWSSFMDSMRIPLNEKRTECIKKLYEMI